MSQRPQPSRSLVRHGSVPPALFTLLPHPTPFSCPKCSNSEPLKRQIVSASNTKGNANRPYYSCSKHGIFLFDDYLHIDSGHPLCDCNFPTREAQSYSGSYFYKCPVGRCNFYYSGQQRSGKIRAVDEAMAVEVRAKEELRQQEVELREREAEMREREAEVREMEARLGKKEEELERQAEVDKQAIIQMEAEIRPDAVMKVEELIQSQGQVQSQELAQGQPGPAPGSGHSSGTVVSPVVKEETIQIKEKPKEREQVYTYESPEPAQQRAKKVKDFVKGKIDEELSDYENDSFIDDSWILNDDSFIDDSSIVDPAEKEPGASWHNQKDEEDADDDDAQTSDDKSIDKEEEEQEPRRKVSRTTPKTPKSAVKTPRHKSPKTPPPPDSAGELLIPASLRRRIRCQNEQLHQLQLSQQQTQLQQSQQNMQTRHNSSQVEDDDLVYITTTTTTAIPKSQLQTPGGSSQTQPLTHSSQSLSFTSPQKAFQSQHQHQSLSLSSLCHKEEDIEITRTPSRKSLKRKTVRPSSSTDDEATYYDAVPSSAPPSRDNIFMPVTPAAQSQVTFKTPTERRLPTRRPSLRLAGSKRGGSSRSPTKDQVLSGRIGGMKSPEKRAGTGTEISARFRDAIELETPGGKAKRQGGGRNEDRIDLYGEDDEMDHM